MKKVLLFVLVAIFAATGIASVYTDRAVSAMDYVTDPANGLYHSAEGLPWIDTDPTNPAAPVMDNQAPSYLGAYFYSTAALIAGMHATGVNIPYADNAVERVFIENFNSNGHPVAGVEPWWNESTNFLSFMPDSMLMGDAYIPWRLDPMMTPPSSANEVYLERVLWSMYFLTLTNDLEYTPYIAKTLRGIRQNPTFFDAGSGAIKYNGTTNTYLTALWGLTLESYMRSFELYPVRARIDPPPVPDYDWTEESEAAWLYIQTMLDYYFNITLPGWWSTYSSPPISATMAPMSASRGLERWEYLPVIMFAAISGNTVAAETLWTNNVDDVAFNTWRDDVIDYFRDGPIWDGTRCVYAPTGRWPGVNAFFELANLEMYRTLVEPVYAQAIIDREDNYWEPTLWDGSYYEQSTVWNSTVIWNGLHAFALAHLPSVEITSIWSDLPSMGTAPYDYNANTAQDHFVTVRVTNNGLVAVDDLVLTFDETYFSGARSDMVAVPRIEPGTYADVTYDVGGPGMAGDHTIVTDFVGIAHIAGYTIIDNDLLVNVQDPAEADVAFSGGSVESAPLNPFITIGQEFEFEVEIQNDGGAAIREVEIDLSQSSPYGLILDFTDGTHFSGVVDIQGGTSGSVYFRAIAPMGVGAMLGDDILVDVDLVRAVDENTLADIAIPVPLADGDEDFDIQYPPSLTVTGIAPAPYWLNATNTVDLTVSISNAAGDYATADRFDIYDQVVELIASTVGGVGGVDLPSVAPVSIAAGVTGDVVFTLSNEGVTENAVVDVDYTGNYHDGNDGLIAEPTASPLTYFAANNMGIDVLAPTVNPIAPVAGAAWPGDNVVQIDADDNLSGVATVDIYLLDEVGGQYWNFTTGVWQAGFYDVSLLYSGGSGYWEATLADHPTGEYIMYIDCGDYASNDMPTDYVPLGDVEYIDLVTIGADLWRGSPAALLPPGTLYDYECDWNWTYRCSVMVYNPSAYLIEDVILNLYSISPQTQAGIVDLTGPIDIPTLTTIWYVFDVTAPAISFMDSLYAHTVDGTYNDGFGDKPIAERILDNNLLIKVEKPVDLSIVETWVKPMEIENWLGDLTDDIEDTALVTMGQQFYYYSTVRNEGEDKIEQAQIYPFQNPNMGSSISRVTPSSWIVDLEAGEEQTFEFLVTASTMNSGDCPVQFDQDMGLDFFTASFTAHNHEMGYVTGLSSAPDDRAPIGIQEKPDLITDDMAVDGVSYPGDVIWINMTNTVTFDLWLYNDSASCATPPFDDRAAADRILGHPVDFPALLMFWDYTAWDPFVDYRTDANINGLEALSATEHIVWPGDITQLNWELSWNGTYAGTYEGVWWVVDEVFYGDNNDQLNLHADNSPHCDTFPFCGPNFMGIDVSKPLCEIVWPWDSVYQEFPETMLVLASDNVSGLVPDSVMVQFEDPTGAIYNGTIWGTGDAWFTAHYDITYGADTFWYDTPTPTEEGCWTYRAYAYDVAGNQSIIDEVGFIWDATEPTCDIISPTDGFYSYTATNVWDRLIEIWALDDTTAGNDCVSHVEYVYVAIFDIIDSVWWDGSGWLASGTGIWLECDPTADPEVWEYTGYTDMSSVQLKVLSWVHDSAGNFGPPCDTLEYIRVDEDVPNSVLRNRFDVELPNMWFVDDTDWDTDMQDKLWGDAEDYFTRVDSVRYSVWDSLNDSYWNGAGWDPSSGEIWNEPDEYNYDGGGWNTPDSPSHAPGIAEGIGKVLAWKTEFDNPGFGYYRVRSKSYDDLGHAEPGFDDENEKVLVFDNCAPVIHPRYPDAGAVYYIWEWVDSMVVYAWDSCGWSMGGGMGAPVDEVRFWILNPDGKYWGYLPFLGWRWCDFEMSVSGVQVNDSLWRPINIPLISEEGTYTMFVRAWDFNGNMTLNAWSWTITVSGEFLTIEALPADPGRDWYFVDEHFTLQTIAWSHPGVPDVSFAHEFTFGDNMPLPENFEILTPEPHYAFRGTLEVECVCHPPVLGLEAFVDVPSSGLPRASTDPIDIIQLVDGDLGGFVIDNDGDQGNWMWLHHNRTTQDPDYTGVEPIDTISVKILNYYYFRDTDTSPATGDTNWQPLVLNANASDGDSVRWMFGNANTFIEYDYSMIAEVRIQWLGDIVFTDRFMLGSGLPVDNIPPQTVDDLVIGLEGGAIRLDWPEARLGSDLAATPEINPEVNITYDVYRFTDPDADLDARAATPTWSVSDTFLVDATGSGDVTTPYYYTVKAKDYESQISPGYTGYVGEVDYNIGVGWNAMAYPLPVDGLVDPMDYVAHTGVALGDMYAYANPPSVWEEVLVGPISYRALSNTGDEDLLVYSPTYSGIATWTGNVPSDMSLINFDLDAGFNGIMIPLDRSDLAMASDLYYELDGMGLNPVTVARMVSGAGWENIFVIDGTPHFDFSIYPGQSYLVWVDDGGTWPDGSRRRPILDRKIGHTSDAIPMPHSMVIPVSADDGAELSEVAATAVWGKQTMECAIDNGMIMVEFSRFENIEMGDQILVRIEADGGAYIGETMVTVGCGPVEISKNVTLAKVAPTLPDEFALRANVPNPFNPVTSIAFDLPEDAQVSLSIYNITGHLVREVVDCKLDAGYHSVVWDGLDGSGRVSSAGVYFYMLKANDFTAKRRMMLVK